ncbi:G protein-activated inward rectifier potassium channel 3-like [Osmerus mordax]|uniref:G protein-activated inward rectifier potassium channel 3-like n=1 Tax=Osmerus mordax TaxID=8014 RepID=UPI00350ECC8E
MVSVTMSSREALLEEQDGDNRSLQRIDARRNSIPPAQTLTAKHLLAYLPRPPPDSTRYTPYPKKVQTKNALLMHNSRRASIIPNTSNHNYYNFPMFLSQQGVCPSQQGVSPSPTAPNTSNYDNIPALSLQQSPSTPPSQDAPAPLQDPEDPPQEPDACQLAIQTEPLEQAAEEIPKPHRSNRGRHIKRFSSKWSCSSPSVAGRDHGNHGPEDVVATGDKALRQRCKLLGDERPSYGTASRQQRQRYVTKDGKCRVNLGPIEHKSRFLSDLFTTLVDLKYRWFLFVFTMCYIVTWVAFAEIYFLDAWLRDDVNHVNDPQWLPCFQNVDSFLSALLLSVESQRTIGYGSRMVTANCMEGVVLLMAQSILGSIIDALMVGCMFVKISRPQKRAQTLIFSKHCVISERDEKLCLLFRIGDLRASHMVDAKIRAKLIKSRQTKEGEFIPLEQSEINLGYDTGGDRLLLVEPQTITHVISDNSPFWETGAESLKRQRFEIIIILEGIVEASGMTCQARTSYTEDEILWGHRFESCMSLEKGAFRVDYSSFDKTFEVQTSALSARQRSEDEVVL